MQVQAALDRADKETLVKQLNLCDNSALVPAHSSLLVYVLENFPQMDYVSMPPMDYVSIGLGARLRKYAETAKWRSTECAETVECRFGLTVVLWSFIGCGCSLMRSLPCQRPLCRGRVMPL